MHPDQKYIEALINNDTVLLNELYLKCSPKITWMVLQNNGSAEDAADIFQEALVSVFQRAISRKLILTCSIENFLRVICRNKWLDELEKRGYGRVTITEDDRYNNLGEDSFKMAEEHGLWQARQNLFTKILHQLGESCSKLLSLSWELNAMTEVAALLNESYGYARKKKTKCIARLRKLLMDDPEFKHLKW